MYIIHPYLAIYGLDTLHETWSQSEKPYKESRENKKECASRSIYRHRKKVFFFAVIVKHFRP